MQIVNCIKWHWNHTEFPFTIYCLLSCCKPFRMLVILHECMLDDSNVCWMAAVYVIKWEQDISSGSFVDSENFSWSGLCLGQYNFLHPTNVIMSFWLWLSHKTYQVSTTWPTSHYCRLHMLSTYHFVSIYCQHQADIGK